MISTATRVLRRVIGLAPWPAGGLVLAYHRVAHLSDDPHQLAVTPENFADHLAVITAHGVPMGLEELVQRARQGDLPARAVAITFDDGYHDVLTTAAPMLCARQVPATVFVSTDAVDRGQEFWWDQPEGRARSSHRPLSPADVSALASLPGITIGSHTRSHPALAALAPDRQREEIVGGRHRLESLIGRPVTTFAYPFGGPDEVSETTVSIARDAGIAIACSTTGGSVRRDVDALRVPRVMIRNWTGAGFEERWRRWMS